MAVAAIAVGIGTARADPILDFTIPSLNPGASIVGDATGLYGTALTITEVAGINTATNNLQIIKIFGGQLNFTTGPLLSSDATTANYDGGNSLVITGVADLNNNNVNDDGPSAVLLAGTFTGAQVVKIGATDFRVAIAAFINSVDPGLANHYGESTGSPLSWTGVMNDQFQAPGTVSNFASTLVASGDLTTTHKIPEPAGAALVCVGLIGLGVTCRHRRRSF